MPSLLITWQRWRSHHSIRCSQKPGATRKFDDSMCYRTRVISDRNFKLWEYGFSRFFCSYDLDLDPLSFIYEHDPYTVEMYRRTDNKLCTSRLSKLRVTTFVYIPSGALFRHTCARHWLVADSLEIGQNLISLQMPTSDPLRTYVIRV